MTTVSQPAASQPAASVAAPPVTTAAQAPVTSTQPPAGSSAAVTTADASALGGLLQQLVNTMSTLTTRVSGLEAVQLHQQVAPAPAPAGQVDVPPLLHTATVTTGSAAAGTVTLTSASVPAAPVPPAVATPTASQPSTRHAALRSARRQHHGDRGRRGRNGGGNNGDNGEDDDSPDDDSSDEDWSDEDWNENSSSSSDSSNSSDGYNWRDRDDEDRRRQRRSVKDLELPTYSPSPNASVSVWIDRVELVMEGARRSGRGNWSDRDLYYILGNKLVENAAKFYTTLNRRLHREERTWSNLKRALLRRYGERVDKSTAEFRVAQRVFAPGETYADFAAGLREAAGRARVRERVLLAQFYRCLNMTVRALVEQRPEPRTLEEAVDKAMKIDKSDANVARGMTTIGQFWPQAQIPGVAQIAGNVGVAAVLPGVGSTQLPNSDMMHGGQQTADEIDQDGFVAFTNPRGAYNTWSGIWEAPKGRTWNGRQWVVAGKAKRGLAQKQQHQAEKRAGKKPEKKAKALVARTVNSSEDEEEDESDAPPPPPRKRRKAPVRQVQTTPKTKTTELKASASAQPGTAPIAEPPECFACGRSGHFARNCTDPVAKARNDAYLAARENKLPKPENDDAAR